MDYSESFNFCISHKTNAIVPPWSECLGGAFFCTEDQKMIEEIAESMYIKSLEKIEDKTGYEAINIILDHFRTDNLFCGSVYMQLIKNKSFINNFNNNQAKKLAKRLSVVAAQRYLEE